MNQDVSVRPYCKDDECFVYSSWLKHYYHSSDFVTHIPHHVYFKYHRIIIDRIIGRRSTVRIAHLKEDPNVIIGFLVMEKGTIDPVIHFIFVKSAFRQMGIAKVLCKGIDLTKAIATHWTHSMDWIYKKYPTIIYSPYNA